MSPLEYANRLHSFIRDFQANNAPFAIAVQTTTQKIGNRIFIEGKNSDGGKIGDYDSSKPFYINPKKSAGDTSGLKPPKGKTGESKFANGRPHKTTYVNSYNDYRTKVKRQSQYVDLKLSGDLQSDFRNARPSQPAQPRKINVNEYVIRLDRPINQKKMQGHNKKYGQISDATQGEKVFCNTIAQKELINQLTKYNLF